MVSPTDDIIRKLTRYTFKTAGQMRLITMNADVNCQIFLSK
jgi:hypothetical protein